MESGSSTALIWHREQFNQRDDGREVIYMAAIAMKAHGTATIVIKEGDKYGSSFRYNNVDYERDCYSGRYYFLDTPRGCTSKVAREGGLVCRRISKAVYEEARKAAIADVESAAEQAGSAVAKGDKREMSKSIEDTKNKKERHKKYAAICARAKAMEIMRGDAIGALMDIESADKKFNLRLDEFLKADNFNFAHDFIGIQNNIIRDEYPATNFGFFIPRFAGQQTEN